MKPRLLIVDDEKNVLLAMQDYFAVHGYEADCAHDRPSAEKLLAEHAYAVLITDLRLTGSEDVEGLEIARYALERQPSLRCILLTAYGSPEIERSAYGRGIRACLSKPRPLNEIVDTVSTLLREPSFTTARHSASMSSGSA